MGRNLLVTLASAASVAGCFMSSSKPDAGAHPTPDGGVGPGFDAAVGSLDSGVQTPAGDATSSEGSATTPCTLTWSGMVSATSACKANGSWDMTTNVGNITLSVTDMSVTSGIGLDLSAAPAVGSYTLDSLAVGTNVSVTITGGDTWSAEKPSTTYEQGSIILSVTSVTATTNVGGTQLYEVHGSLMSVLASEMTINFVNGMAAGTVTSTGSVNLVGSF